jgi:hypothetical protein
MRYSGLTGAGINIMSLSNLVGQALRGFVVVDRVQRFAFETSWSSSEVVKRGTGSNYGQDGFLRPGFSYEDLIDYLFDKVMELFEIEAQNHDPLSRDWKVRIAAAMIPRGLENDTFFLNCLLAQLDRAINRKFDEVARKLIGTMKLSPDHWRFVTAEKSRIRLSSQSKPEVESATATGTKKNIEDYDFFQTKVRTISKALQRVLFTLKETVDCSIQLRLGNNRISSELYNQPKPVDSVIDECATDSQMMVNALTRTIVLAAATICLYRHGNNSFVALSGLFGISTFFYAYNAFLLALRYRTRNALHVREFLESKLNILRKNIYSIMSKDQRSNFPYRDPCELCLERSVDRFLQNAKYYNSDESSITAFRSAYAQFTAMEKKEARIIQFIRKLLEEFVADLFHTNSYLQEDLVQVYKELLEMRTVFKVGSSHSMKEVDTLYKRLQLVVPVLESHYLVWTYRRDTVPASFRYMFSPLSGGGKIALETKAMADLSQTILAVSNQDSTVRRLVRDLKELNYSVRNFDLANAVIFFAFGSMTFAIVISCLRIIELVVRTESTWVEKSNEVLQWISIFALGGAIVASSCMILRMNHLRRVHIAISRLQSTCTTSRQLLSITSFKMIIAVFQFVTTTIACVALLWMLAESVMTDKDSFGWWNIPLVLSSISMIVMLSASILSSTTEFLCIHKLNPCFCTMICNLFRPTIEQLLQAFARKSSGLDIEPAQIIERETWEYTAREFLHHHRFDVILDTNRFGILLQSIQSGATFEKSTVIPAIS